MKLYQYICTACKTEVWVTWDADHDKELMPNCPEDEECGIKYMVQTGISVEVTAPL